MQSLQKFLRLLLVLSVSLSACAPLANRDSTPTPTPPPAPTTSLAPTASATAHDTMTRNDATATRPASKATTTAAESSAATATVSVLTPTPTSVVFESGPRPTPTLAREEAMARLDELMLQLEDLRAEIDRTQFDVAALEFELGFDAEDNIDFVRKDIYFEQYPGVLRGARGTLMSRAGNALDQAILLATLLGDAGYETRIVQGVLSRDQARTLVQQMAVPRSRARPIGNLQAMHDIVTNIAELADVPPEAVDRVMDSMSDPAPIQSVPAYDAAQEDAEFLLATLEGEDIQPAGIDLEEVVAEAQDYFWLEYRLGPSDQWQDVHPAFTDEDMSPADVEAETVFTESVPESLQHRFRFQVFIEQKLGDKLQTYPIMDAWERPVANMLGVPLTFTNFADTVATSDQDAAAMATSLRVAVPFVPMFNNNLAPGGLFFSLDGERIDPIAAESAAAGVFDNVGNAFEDATGALSGEDDGEDQVALTRQWIEYTLIAPDGTERTISRTVIDRIGAENRAAGAVAIAAGGDPVAVIHQLTRVHTIMLAPGRYPDAYVLDQLLQKMLDLRIPLEVAISKAYDPDAAVSVPEQEVADVDLAWSGHLPLYSVFDEPILPDGAITYRPEPSIVVHQKDLGLQPAVRASVDVVNNTRRVFRTDGERLVASADDLIRIGTWETHTEGSMIGVPGSGQSVTQFNTMVALQQARDADIPLRTITPENRAEVDTLSLPARARRNLTRDLDADYVVVVPEAMPPDAEMTGWWRVHRETGETLGMTSDGRGQDGTGYSILLQLISGTLLVVIGTSICMGYVAVRGKDVNNIFTCLGVSVGAVMVPYSAVIGFALAAAIALIDIEVDFDPTQPDCPPNSICRP